LSTPYSRLPKNWQPFQSVYRYLCWTGTGLELLTTENKLSAEEVIRAGNWQKEEREWFALPPVFADGLWLDNEAMSGENLPGNLRVVLNTESWVLFAAGHPVAAEWAGRLSALGFEKAEFSEKEFVLFRIRPVACCGVLR
jgi:hypothetical protein